MCGGRSTENLDTSLLTMSDVNTITDFHKILKEDIYTVNNSICQSPQVISDIISSKKILPKLITYIKSNLSNNYSDHFEKHNRMILYLMFIFIILTAVFFFFFCFFCFFCFFLGRSQFNYFLYFNMGGIKRVNKGYFC